MWCSNRSTMSLPKRTSDLASSSTSRRVVWPMRSGFGELARGALIALCAALGVTACQGWGDLAELVGDMFEPSPDQTAAAQERVLLEQGWLLREVAAVPQAGAALTAAGFSPSGWYRATVPGTVLTSLVNEGLYPEPLYGLNNLRIPESLNRTPFWYWKGFEIPGSYAGKRIWLHLDGINFEAELWLNGERLGSMKGAFKRARLDITRLARFDRPNSLAVKILPPPHPGTPHEQTLTDAGPNGGGLGEDSPTFVASIGWDWMPAIRDRNMGIWQEVYLSATGPLVLEFPHVVTDLPLPDTSQADLRITAEVRNASNAPQRGIVKGTVEGISFEQAVSVGPYETKLVAFDKGAFPQLTLHNPRLWWPNGYGEQALYTLDLEIGIDGQVSSTQQVRFGVREMSYWQNKFEPSVDLSFAPRAARYVRMLGIKRATGWGFSLWELAVFGPGSGATNLALRKPSSASSIESASQASAAAFDGSMSTRWSSLYSEPQWLMVDLGAVQTVDRVHLEWEIAHASDYKIQTSTDGKQWLDAHHFVGGSTQLQILVNGQRILCKGGNWGLDEAMKRVSRARYAAQIRLHKEAHLTMIRNWVGQTDDEDFYELCDESGLLIWDDFWLANPVDGPDPADAELFLDSARDKIKRYRNHPSVALWCGRNEGRPPAVIDQGLAKAVAELDGTRRYQSTSNDDGVHGNGPYSYNPPEYYFETRAHGFSTEVGLPSIPTVEGVSQMMPAQDRWPISRTWGYHDFSGGACGAVNYASVLTARYGAPSGLADFCRKGQMINYETHKAVFEAWNHILWQDGSGTLLWMSSPAQPSFVWQLYDYDLEPNASFFGAKKAAEPVHIQLNLDDLSVYVINNTLGALADLRAEASIYGLDGRLANTQSATVSPAANEFTRCFDLAVPSSVSRVYFVKLLLRDEQGRVLSDNFYWRASDKRNYTALDTLPRVELTGEASTEVGWDETNLRARIRNPSPTVAVAVRLKLMKGSSGARILPVFYEDNYFSLLPGEAKDVQIRFFPDDLAGEQPDLRLEGWNVNPGRVLIR